ncbi:unnamed protein product [Moneuplotes crassus]|uniref:Uncharacterized protein n=1 Tax=Euplotes crassus TaxID=5936 RepID=A0AAD1X7X0_EUPCR|nr:unnamed protein product [Moneuplotes crassus]
MMEQLREEIKEVHDFADSRVSYEGLQEHVEILRAEMGQITTKLVDLKKLDMIQNTIDQQIYEIRKKQGARDTTIDNIIVKFGDMSKRMENFSLKEDVKLDIQQLWNHFDHFPKISKLAKYKDEITPIVDKCKEDVEYLSKEVDKSKKIISRFDEVMLEKASKFSVDQLRKECTQTYAKLREFNEFKIITADDEREIKNEIAEIKSILEESHDKLFIKLSDSMDRYAKILNASYGKPVNASELHMHLNCKADKSETEGQFDVKADKKELNLTDQNITALHEQLNQLGVLLCEYVQLDFNDPLESKSKIIKDKKEFIKNMKIYVNWIRKPLDSDSPKFTKHKKKEIKKKNNTFLLDSKPMSIRPLTSLSKASFEQKNQKKEKHKNRSKNNLKRYMFSLVHKRDRSQQKSSQDDNDSPRPLSPDSQIRIENKQKIVFPDQPAQMIKMWSRNRLLKKSISRNIFTPEPKSTEYIRPDHGKRNTSQLVDSTKYLPFMSPIND